MMYCIVWGIKGNVEGDITCIVLGVVVFIFHLHYCYLKCVSIFILYFCFQVITMHKPLMLSLCVHVKHISSLLIVFPSYHFYFASVAKWSYSIFVSHEFQTAIHWYFVCETRRMFNNSLQHYQNYFTRVTQYNVFLFLRYSYQCVKCDVYFIFHSYDFSVYYWIFYSCSRIWRFYLPL